jgi:hypothetical protein
LLYIRSNLRSPSIQPRGRVRVDLCVEAMKITALLVLKPSTSGAGSSSSGGESGPEAVVLANAIDVSHFGYFQRSAAREFIVFVARTVAQRTQPGQRQSVQHEGNLRSDRFLDLYKIWGPY